MLMNISTKFHACIRMCMIIVTSRSTSIDFLGYEISLTICTAASQASYYTWTRNNNASLKLMKT